MPPLAFELPLEVTGWLVNLAVSAFSVSTPCLHCLSLVGFGLKRTSNTTGDVHLQSFEAGSDIRQDANQHLAVKMTGYLDWDCWNFLHDLILLKQTNRLQMLVICGY